MEDRRLGGGPDEELELQQWQVELLPPPLASRAVRRRCKHRMKHGYCGDCGTPARKGL